MGKLQTLTNFYTSHIFIFWITKFSRFHIKLDRSSRFSSSSLNFITSRTNCNYFLTDMFKIWISLMVLQVYAWTAVTPKAKSRWTLFPVLYSKKILQKLILESLWNTSHVNSRVLVESYLWNMPRILIVVKCLVTMKHDAFSTTGKRDMKNTEMFTRVLFGRFIARVGKSTYP